MTWTPRPNEPKHRVYFPSATVVQCSKHPEERKSWQLCRITVTSLSNDTTRCPPPMTQWALWSTRGGLIQKVTSTLRITENLTDGAHLFLVAICVCVKRLRQLSSQFTRLRKLSRLSQLKNTSSDDRPMTGALSLDRADLTWHCSKVIRLKGWRQRRRDYSKRALYLTHVLHLYNWLLALCLLIVSV